MIRLNSFIDFAYSLVEMDEVKENGFPTPKELTFELNKVQHSLIQRELHEEKGEGEFNHMDVFEMELFGITFKFIEKI